MNKNKKIIMLILTLAVLAAGSWLLLANIPKKNTGADYTGTVETSGMELYKTLVLSNVSSEEAARIAANFNGKVVKAFEPPGLYEIGFDNISSFEDLKNKKESMESAGHNVLYNPKADDIFE